MMIEKTFIQQGIRRMEMEKYLKQELQRAGFTKADIIKTPMVTRIVVNVVNPGLAIGKSGQNIKSLTEMIEKRFKIDNPQLEIRQIEKPELDAQAQADKIKSLLERGFSWRSVAYKAVREITGAGAQGVELLMRGKLAGKGGRKRKQRIAAGYMKKVGHQAKLVDVGQASAYPKAGAIGVKISIVRPDVVFPDKVAYDKLLEQRIASEETEAKEVKETVKVPAEKAEEKPAEKKPAKAVKEEKEKQEVTEKTPEKNKEEKNPEAKKPAKEVKKAEKKEETAEKAKPAEETKPKEEKKEAKETKKEEKAEASKEEKKAEKPEEKKAAKEEKKE